MDGHRTQYAAIYHLFSGGGGATTFVANIMNEWWSGDAMMTVYSTNRQ